MSRKTAGSVQERASETDDPAVGSPADEPGATGETDEGAPPAARTSTTGADSASGSDVSPVKSGERSPLKRALGVARRALIPAVSVLAVVATVAAAYFGRKVEQQNDIQAAAAEALAAARAYAVTLTSVDSADLDSDFAAVLDGSTGEFRDMYTRSSGQLRELLVENKAAGQGTVLDAAVKSASETEVEVLLFIDQTVTNAASPDPRIDRSRVVMTMQLVDGRWLAARVYLP